MWSRAGDRAQKAQRAQRTAQRAQVKEHRAEGTGCRGEGIEDRAEDTGHRASLCSCHPLWSPEPAQLQQKFRLCSSSVFHGYNFFWVTTKATTAAVTPHWGDGLGGGSRHPPPCANPALCQAPEHSPCSKPTGKSG